MSETIKKPFNLDKDISENKFPCNQCGWCCQNLKNNTLYKALDSGNGVCIYFKTNDNSCAIYDDRPLICNIEAMYNTEFSTMNYDEYITLNVQACQLAQIENKLPIIQI